MNRFSKDIDTLDNVIVGESLIRFSSMSMMVCLYGLSVDSLRIFINMFATVIGAIILVAIVLPWFLIAVGVCIVLYIMASAYYRASAREIQVGCILSQCVVSYAKR